MWARPINILKTILKISLVVLVSFAISLGLHVSVNESIRMPTTIEMKSLDNISKDLDFKEKQATMLSRHSVLKVLSSREDVAGFTKMSGTYVEYDDKFYVITAAHGIMGECEFVFVAAGNDSVYSCIKYIIVDQETDYAIIQIEEVSKRTPVKLELVVPAPRQWLQETSVLNEVFYTGYPNGLGPLTFRGSVAGVSDENYIYLHSYAWPGSSGAGVFSNDGQLIGIVVALNVGLTGAGYDVLEDLVIITPLFLVDWESAYEIMEETPTAVDTGDTAE
jgi:S1-C subfamily serine protease